MKKLQRKEENEIEGRDSIEITAIEKEPLARQLIDALYVEGLEKQENECQFIQELEISKTPKPDNIFEQEIVLKLYLLKKILYHFNLLINYL